MVCALIAQQSTNSSYVAARELYQAGKYEIALEEIQRNLRDRKSSEGYLLEASIYEALGESMSAIRSLTDLLDLDDVHREALFKRGQLYYIQGMYLLSIKDLTRVLEIRSEGTKAVLFRLDPDGQDQVQITTLATMMAEVRALRAQAFQAMGEYELAKVDFDSALHLNPSADLYVNRALYYQELGNNELAKSDLEQALTYDPLMPLAWYNLMLVDPKTDVPDVIASSSTFAPMLIHRGVEAFQEGDLDLAGRLFDQALRIRPENYLLRVNSGRLAYAKGEFDQARFQYGKALELHPNRFEVYYLVGNSFFREKKYEEAAAFYEEYLARDQSNAQIWYNAAVAYFALRDSHTGCLYLTRAIERGIDSSLTVQYTGRCEQ